MKTTKIISVLAAATLVITVFSTIGFASQTLKKETMERPFKVIGYYSGSLFEEPIERLQTDKLTHVIYAFLIPREDGTLVDLEKPGQLNKIVQKAHADGAKVFIAVGGWSYQNQRLQPVFEKAAASAETRRMLIENICSFVTKYGLDGVELDWEHPHADSITDYEKLVTELKKALDQQGKEITAAINGAWSATEGPEVSSLMTDACLKSFSFINVMAYDMNNEAHSPLWFAEASIDYWLNRGVPAENIILGMPLYARPSWLQYRHLAAQNPEYAYQDYAATLPLESYYNGINTLREKTVIALSKAGGIMLFDVNEDTDDETSIVSMIDGLKMRIGCLSPAGKDKYVTVILDNRELVFLEEEGYGVPFIDGNNRAMIPVRKPLEAIGATVIYDDKNRIVTAAKGGTIVKLAVGAGNITVNGREAAIDTKPIIKDGRTYIPLRAVLTAFGCGIEWHGNSRTILISSPTPGAGLTAPSDDTSETSPCVRAAGFIIAPAVIINN